MDSCRDRQAAGRGPTTTGGLVVPGTSGEDVDLFHSSGAPSGRFVGARAGAVKKTWSMPSGELGVSLGRQTAHK